MQLTDSDSDLICAYLAGDRTAWHALVQRYRRLLYSIPLRRGLSEDDAADVFQNVCLKLFQNLHRLRDQERVVGWLITIATREAWRVRSKTQQHVHFSELDSGGAGESCLEDLPATDPLPQDVVMRLEEQQMVREAMGELCERCRRLLGLLYDTEPPPSYAEIARSLEMAEGSVGPTRARCLQQLRRILERRTYRD